MSVDRDTVVIRTARASEAAAVVGVIDRALLAVDRAKVRQAVRSDNVLVAVERNRIIGVLVLAGSMLQAIAVRPRHRHQRIGTALVNRAAASTLPLAAQWEASVDPFYRSLGFSRYPLGAGVIFGIKRTNSVDRLDE